MDLSIIIPSRREKLLKFTVEHAKAAAPGAEIIIINDDDGRLGSDQARDQGICRAKHQACLVIDGHCNFWGELNPWAEILVAHAHDHPQDFGCCVCVALEVGASGPLAPVGSGEPPEPTRLDMHGYWITSCGKRRFRQHNRYYGAYIRLKDHDGAFNRIFCDKWNSAEDYRQFVHQGMEQEICCPLGGAYLLNRDWYLDGLKRPWQALPGWGTSEIALALPNWLLGGRNVLLPVEIGHAFRRQSPYCVPTWQILYNQLRLLHVLPMPDSLRINLRDHLKLNNWPATVWHAAQSEILAQYRNWQALTSALENAPRTWEQWTRHWLEKSPAGRERLIAAKTKTELSHEN